MTLCLYDSHTIRDEQCHSEHERIIEMNWNVKGLDAIDIRSIVLMLSKNAKVCSLCLKEVMS